MTKLFHAQIDLFTGSVMPVELTGDERQKAVALLQALLTEAATKPAGQLSTTVKRGAGDE
jgi:hypothetical protein